MSSSIGVIVSVAVLFLVKAPAQAANPFGMGRVDYFNETSLTKTLDKQQHALDWREPIVGLNGQVTYYTPPDAVLALLENPTEENAKAYVEWQNAKTDKILKAQQALEAVADKGGP